MHFEHIKKRNIGGAVLFRFNVRVSGPLRRPEGDGLGYVIEVVTTNHRLLLATGNPRSTR